MKRIGLIGVLVLGFAPAAAPGPATIPPPSQPGPWRQLGKVVTSRPGAQLYLLRQLASPKALAVVATSSSARPIRLTWRNDCALETDESMGPDDSGTTRGARRVTRYLTVAAGAPICRVQVTARIAGTPKARVAAAVFGY